MDIKGYKSPIAIHPGETIKETLEVLGITQANLSIRAELAEKTISEIFNGKNPVTPETALKFERILGISKEGLINMQARYDEDLARIEEEERLREEIKHLERFSCYFELVKLNFVEKTINKIEKVENLLRFFSVNSLSSIRQTMPVAYRKSRTQKINSESLAAWLRIGHITAQTRDVEDFDIVKLRNSLNDMRALTVKDPKDYSKELIELCRKCGVVLVYTPSFKNVPVNGATRWITPKKALIQISLRNSYADIFWFTFFHEIGHLLKHSKKETFVNFNTEKSTSNMEKDADSFAEKVLIPSKVDFDNFKKNLIEGNSNFGDSIIDFSKSIGIDVGIVAGRVSRELGDWRSTASLRKKLTFQD